MSRLVLVFLAVFSAGPTSALDIPGDPSSCGIVIERGDPGELQGDLDCATGAAGTTTSAITLRPGAKLYLNGHRVSNDIHAVACDPSVLPPRTCTIQGPGEITGAFNGIAASSKAKVRDVTIHGNDTGIWKPYGDLPHLARLDLTNVVIRDNTGDGVRGGGAIRATDTTIRDNGGVGATSFGPSRLLRTTITGNGSAGIITGVYNDFYQQYFYSERSLVLVDSDVSGNGLDDAMADLVAAKRPKLTRSTCGTSADPTAPGNPAWGVCGGD